MVLSAIGVVYFMVGAALAVAPHEYHLSLVFSDLPADTYTGTVRVNFVHSEDGTESFDVLAMQNYVSFSRVDVLLIESDYVSIEIVRVEPKEDKVTITVARPLRKGYNYKLVINFVGATGPLGVIFDRDIVYSNFSRATAHAGFPCFEKESKFDLQIYHSGSWDSYSFSKGKRYESYDNTTGILQVMKKFSTNSTVLPNTLSFVLVRDYRKLNSSNGDLDSSLIEFLAPKGATEISKYLQRCATLNPFWPMINGSEYATVFVSIPGLTVDYFSNLNMIYIKSSLMGDDLEMTTDNNADFCLNILKLLAEQFFGIRLHSEDAFLNQAVPFYLSVVAFHQVSDFWSERFVTEKLTEVNDLAFKEESILKEESGAKGAAFLGMLDDWMETKGSDLRMYNFIVDYFNIRYNRNDSSIGDLYDFTAKRDFICNISQHFPKESWESWMNLTNVPFIAATVVNVNEVQVECFNANAVLVVPLVYKIGDRKRNNVTFITCLSSSVISDNATVRVFLNPSGAGLYRVQYQYELWNLLMEGDLKNIPVPGRSRLISDALEFTLPHTETKELTPFNALMDITNYLTNEYSCTPWIIALKKMYILRNAFFSDQKLTAAFRQRVLMMMEYFTHFLGLGRSSRIHNMCRKTIFQANVIFGTGNLTSTLIETYYKVYWNVFDLKNLGGDAWTTARCAMLSQNGNLNDWWERFENMYSDRHNTFKKRRLSEEYSCSIAPVRVLSKIVQMDPRDFPKYFEHFTSVAENVGVTLKFMSTLKKMKVPSGAMKTMLKIIGPRINNRDKNSLNYLKNIAKNYPDLQNDVSKAEEQMKAMQEFCKKNQEMFQQWLLSPLDPPRVPTWAPLGLAESATTPANRLEDHSLQSLGTRRTRPTPTDLALFFKKLSEHL